MDHPKNAIFIKIVTSTCNWNITWDYLNVIKWRIRKNWDTYGSLNVSETVLIYNMPTHVQGMKKCHKVTWGCETFIP